MDSSFNDIDDNIRPPEESFNERLLEDTRTEFEKQIDEAMYLSMKEINQQQDINRQYEEQLMKDYFEESNRRKDIFKDFLFNLNKLIKFDKDIREIYNIIEPIIESYCGQYIQSCELDEETYDRIFNTLKKIRNNQIAFDTLKSIILMEQ